MKKFELWDFDNETNKIKELEEVKVIDFLKSLTKKLIGPFKKLFNLSSYKFGQSKTMTISIPIPQDIMEAKSNRKNNGSQVEMMSSHYLAMELDRLTFSVELKLENKVVTFAKMKRAIDEMQKKIESNSLHNPKIDVNIADIKKKNAKDYEMRKNYAYVTATVLADTVKKDMKEYPSMYTVVIDSAGESGQGKTKADILIDYTVKKMDHSEVIPKLHGYAISHKFSVSKNTMGSQINSVYGLIFAITTGQYAKGQTKETIRGIVDPILNKKLGKEFVERLKYFWGHKEERYDTKAKQAIDMGSQKEFERGLKQYYDFAATLIESHPYEMLKFIGIEEGVDHFMVAFNNSTKQYDAYSSIDSAKYKKFVDQIFNVDFRKDMTCKAQRTGDRTIEIEYIRKGVSYYKTKLTAEENNCKKSKTVVWGLGKQDLDDAETSHEIKFPAPVFPKDLAAKVPKDSKSKTLKAYSSKNPVKKVEQKVTQKSAIDQWMIAAGKYYQSHTTAANDSRERKIKRNADSAVSYIMGGMSAKEAVELSVEE